MGVITSNNFDPTRGYVGVRLQQGVPIVDRDWNEMEDIRKFELRAFLKWFIGDGVPRGSGAFLIESTGEADNFLISSGESGSNSGFSPQDIGLYFVGNCLVDGLDVSIAANMKFKDQPLHVSQPGASVLSTALGVPVISAVSLPPAANMMVVVYLDVWEQLVTPNDDPQNLILPGLGTESCARTKREWVVRTNTIPTTGAPLSALPTVPVPMAAGSGYPEGHSFYALATIMSDGSVNDKRQTRLTLADLVQRVSLLDIPAFNPAPNQFNPTRGKAGDLVTLYGRNFTVGGIPTVKFGAVGSTAVGFVFDPATGIALTATVPPNVVGPLDPRNVKITITTGVGTVGGGTVVSDSLFTVIGPPAFGLTGHQFTPPNGRVNDQITLSGNNFDGPNLKVGFVVSGQTPLTANIVSGTITATQVTVAIPSPGPFTTALSAKFTVQTDLGGPVTSTDMFTLLP